MVDFGHERERHSLVRSTLGHKSWPKGPQKEIKTVPEDGNLLWTTTSSVSGIHLLEETNRRMDSCAGAVLAFGPGLCLVSRTRPPGIQGSSRCPGHQANAFSGHLVSEPSLATS